MITRTKTGTRDKLFSFTCTVQNDVTLVSGFIDYYKIAWSSSSFMFFPVLTNATAADVQSEHFRNKKVKSDLKNRFPVFLTVLQKKISIQTAILLGMHIFIYADNCLFQGLLEIEIRLFAHFLCKLYQLEIEAFSLSTFYAADYFLFPML